ncbi:MAG: tetratricopeptide repeat protein [Myxococcota bacterium]|jgi:tetratricopeptide (TPR) repeat protein|nr:tetratricopeptide repeat protein [Myxococcota bacterium]
MNRISFITAIILSLSLSTVLALASENQSARNFLEANSTFQKGNYEDALKQYAQLIEKHPGNGHLYYNQGNTYLRLGRLGAAIAAYRQGLVFLPRNQDLKANLTYARTLTKDDIKPVGAHPLVETLFFWHYFLNQHELVLALVVINMLFWLSMACRLYFRGQRMFHWLNVGTFGLILAFGASLLVHRVAPQTIALVNEPEIEVYAANRVDSVVRFKLHAGSEVAVIDENQNWLRIRLDKTQEGWLEKSKVALVHL